MLIACGLSLLNRLRQDATLLENSLECDRINNLGFSVEAISGFSGIPVLTSLPTCFCLRAPCAPLPESPQHSLSGFLCCAYLSRLSVQPGGGGGEASRTNGLDLLGQELEVMSAKARESETQQPCQSQQTLPISFPKELCDSLSSKPPIHSKNSQRSHNIHASNLA